MTEQLDLLEYLDSMDDQLMLEETEVERIAHDISRNFTIHGDNSLNAKLKELGLIIKVIK